MDRTGNDRTAEVAIDGSCAPGYEGVRSAFTENFAAGDLGASCAVTVDGELVVDLWGGHRDVARTQPWERDTIVNLWSTTKMLTALCVLILHDRGQLPLDSAVAEHWPEFAASGKGDVLVRHLMAHTAGLPVFDDPVDDLVIFDWAECCRRLASQRPRWTPGDGSGYHSETQGWLLGELVARTTGSSLGTFFGEEVAGPLGLDLHIGLGFEHFARVADMATLHAARDESLDAEISELQQTASGRSAGLVNTAGWRGAELPASNGHGNARGVALAMAPLANGGASTGAALLGPASIERIFDVQSDGIDRVLGRHMRFGIGYGLNSAETPLGVNDRTCWWAGWGGSMCVVDVENRLTVSYVMNRMLGADDLRAARVVFAAHAAGQSALPPMG